MNQMYPQPDEPDQTQGGGDDAAGQDDEKMEGETALLPKSILGGKDFQPGDEVVLKIVGMHDDEVEVAYAPEKPGGADDEEMTEEPAGEMDQAQNRLASMGGNSGGY
jgi:hypothetical protein